MPNWAEVFDVAQKHKCSNIEAIEILKSVEILIAKGLTPEQYEAAWNKQVTAND